MFKRTLSCLKLCFLGRIPVSRTVNFGSGPTQMRPNRLGVILLAVQYEAAIVHLHQWKMTFRLHKSGSFILYSASLLQTIVTVPFELHLVVLRA